MLFRYPKGRPYLVVRAGPLEDLILLIGLCGYAGLSSEVAVFENHIVGVVETDGILHLADGDVAEPYAPQGLRSGALKD